MLIETDHVSQPRVVFFIVDSPPHSLAEEDVQLANQAEVEDNSLQPSAEEEVQSTNQAEDDLVHIDHLHRKMLFSQHSLNGEELLLWLVGSVGCFIGLIGIVVGIFLLTVCPPAAVLFILFGAALVAVSLGGVLYFYAHRSHRTEDDA